MSHKRIHRTHRLLLTLAIFVAAILLAGYARPAAAAPDDAVCGDVVINEIKFKQDGSGTTPVWNEDEWVELYTTVELPAGTVIKLDDMESNTGRFQTEFTLATAVPADKYIVVHANTQAESESPTAGYLNIYEAGNSLHSPVLNNTGDNIVLYVNSSACEEVHWGSRGSNANNGPPSPSAAIEYAYGSASNVSAGESIQRNPNGTGTVFLQGDDSAFPDKTTIGYNNNGPSTLVTLVSFTAVADGDKVTLAWETGAEIDNAGFNLYRADSDSSPQVRVNDQLLAARGQGMGASYAYEDGSLDQGSYFYWLEDVDFTGMRTLHGPVQVRVEDAGAGNQRSLFLPIVSGQ